MDINKIPDIFQSKIRISIISSLISGEKTFSQIKDLTKATDGNLSVHLSKLKKVNYIKVRKDFFKNKPRTRYKLTQLGIDEFKNYVSLLENILSDN